MFDAHPEVFVFRESHWIPKMYEVFGTAVASCDELVEIVLSTRHVDGEGVFPGSPEDLATIFPQRETLGVAEFCERMGRALADRAGKSFWADKTPDYGPYMGLLQLLWPGCRFIHLVREGASVVHSMSKHPGFRWLAGAGETWWIGPSFNGYHMRWEVPDDVPLRLIADLWSRRLGRILDESGRLAEGSYREVRLEELVANPRPILRQLASYVGLEAPESWLAAAASLVDRRRATKRAPRAARSVLQPGHRRLLQDLGYGP
jgi:hypothetical protein